MSKNALVACFVEALGVDEKLVVDDLEYNSIAQWDSVAHMTLIAALEERFDIMLDTDDIIDKTLAAADKCFAAL